MNNIKHASEFKLYHYHESLCSQAVRLALEEKGISWKSRPIILNELVREGDNFKPEYLRINPKGWYLPLFITASPFTTAG